MSDPQRLYFGHPVNAYGTELQRELLRKIAFVFPDWEIVNPDTPEHAASYAAWAKTHVDEEEGRASGMGYFFGCVLPTCQGGVFLAFRDGRFGRGVFGEAEWLFARRLPIWEISFDGIVSPLERLDAARCLGLSETRRRIRNPDGTPTPY